jgi:transcriptional activator of comK gene
MWRPLAIIVVLFALIFAGCQPIPSASGRLQKVGLLVPDTVNDQVWGTKGYKGLLGIQSKFDVDVFYKEGMNSKAAVRQAVEEFQHKGVNLVFGHGSEYAEYFNELADEYPNMHFVCFNGEAKKKNVTSLNFKGNAMGFFGGMVAGHMTKTNKVGVIAAFEWQPEVNGFFEGALYENEKVDVKVRFVQHWDDVDAALKVFDEMIAEGVDVVYPAGDGFNVPVIEKAKEHGLYAIGYVSDQADLGRLTVLTSTVQHVDRLYELVAEQFQRGKLKSGNLYFDFKDGVVTLGKFSPLVDEQFRKKIEQYIERYKKTGKLPNE